MTTIFGEGRLSHPLSANIAIPASDDPSGIIAFAQYPFNTLIVQEGGSVTMRILRSAGLFGSVSVQWQITPADSTAFLLTTGSVLFNDGTNEVNLTLMVR